MTNGSSPLVYVALLVIAIEIYIKPFKVSTLLVLLVKVLSVL